MPDSREFLVVGIGASAGGVQAIRAFFEHVAPDSGIAYVVVLHLSPDYESHLADVLQTITTIPVTQVDGRVQVSPDHVYVIPPNKGLRMTDDHLDLVPVASLEERRAPIDIFYRTMADSIGRRAVSVVLSGSGADGSMGLKRVKEHGGLVLAQDPREAGFGDMPRHSIDTGFVDQILSVADMPSAITAYRDALTQLDAYHSLSDVPDIDEGALRDILTQLRLRTGHDFSNYKRATVLRRTARRMSLHRLTRMSDYAQYVRENRDKATALLKDLLISVTNFFRDREAFARLETLVVPKLFEGKGEDDHVRVWIAGCATGEEVYSIAMLLAEQSGAMSGSPRVQIFATDIDEAAIATARDAVYTINDAADVSPERLRQFFTKDGERYRVRKELRELVLFATHNLIKDPPFSHLDLLCCRNLLIYLNRVAQRRAMEVMHFALNPGGYLFLGSSESVEGAADLFSGIDKEAFLYQSRAVVSKVGTAQLALSLPTAQIRRSADTRSAEPRDRDRLSAAALHQRLLEAYAPPSIVVSAEHDIVHLSEHAGRYLQFSGGEPSTSILKVIRPELRIELRSALYQAAQQLTDVAAAGITVRLDDRLVQVNLLVRPVLKPGDPAEGLFVVLFEEAGSAPNETAPAAPLASGDSATQLEEEVLRVKGQLRATVERHETQAEELKASNEELQAMNEELRSAAEELETSKEELESVNEELRTVNQELKIKVEEQKQANDDTQNLINATEIGTIFLDRVSRIKLFTPHARDIFTLIPADRGRPLSDISSALIEADLHRDIEQVLDRLERVEREVQVRDGRWYLMRVLPYLTADNRIDGVVLTFVDISARRAAEAGLRASEDRMRRAFTIDTVAVSFYDRDGLITEANDAFLRMTGHHRADVTARRLHRDAVVPRPGGGDGLGTDGEALDTSEREYVRTDGSRWWGLCSTAVISPHDRVEFVVDISSRMRTEEQLRQSESRSRLLIESVMDYAIFTMDASGRIDSWNAAASRVFGFTEPEVLGHPSAMLFTPEDRANGIPEAELRNAGEVGRAPDERWHVRGDGSRFFASGAVSPLRDGHDRIIGFVKVARDLTERRQWEEALQQAHAELEERVLNRTKALATANAELDAQLQERREAERQVRSLMRRLLTVQEDERRRIARDLHDQLGQQVAGASLRIEGLGQLVKADPVLVAAVDAARASMARLDRDLDFFTWELRPATLDDLGLPETLRTFVREWSSEFGIAAEFHARGLDGLTLGYEVETNLYRIAQEALNNAYKHAGAQRVDVILERRESDLLLVVEDNGRGLERQGKAESGSDRGIGLLGMRERAAFIGGTLDIESGPTGTTIFARVPVPAVAS